MPVSVASTLRSSHSDVPLSVHRNELNSVRMDSAKGFSPRFLRVTPRFSKVQGRDVCSLSLVMANLKHDGAVTHRQDVDQRAAMPEAIDASEFPATCLPRRGTSSSCDSRKLPNMYLIDLASSTIDGVGSSCPEQGLSIDLANLENDSLGSDAGKLEESTSSPTCSELLESAVSKSRSLIEELKDLSGDLDIDLDRSATESTASHASSLADSSPRPGRDDFKSFVLGRAKSSSSLVSTSSPCSDVCSSPWL